MDPSQFDAFSRTLAREASRRQAVARWGAAGLVAALAAALGRGGAEAAGPLAQNVTCRLSLVANVGLGPSAGTTLQGSTPGELRGDLDFTLGPDGAIDDGRLRLTNGPELPVVGQATGRAINLRVQAGIAQTIVLVGVAEQSLERCSGAVDGLLTGPQVGDLGDWHAIAEAVGGTSEPEQPAPSPTPTIAPATAPPSATPPPATAAPTATGAPPLTATPPASPTVTATPAPTETPTPTPTPTPTSTPTPTAEPCPPGMTPCGGMCVDLQSDPANCGACGNVCSFICDAGQCTFLQACLSPQVACGNVCVDLQTDPNNCGACGNACLVIETCAGGECQPGELAPADA